MVATASSIYCLMTRPSQSQMGGFQQKTPDGESRTDLPFVASLLKLSHLSPHSWITRVTSGTEAGSEGWSLGQMRVGLVSTRQYNRPVLIYWLHMLSLRCCHVSPTDELYLQGMDSFAPSYTHSLTREKEGQDYRGYSDAGFRLSLQSRCGQEYQLLPAPKSQRQLSPGIVPSYRKLPPPRPHAHPGWHAPSDWLMQR